MSQKSNVADIPDVSAQCAAYALLLKSVPIRLAIARVTAAARALADESTFVHMQAAISESAVSGCDLSSILRNRETELLSQREQAINGRQEYERFCAAARKVATPILNRTARETLEIPIEITALESRILNFDNLREQNREALARAGLDEGAITRAGLSPSHEHLHEWKRQLTVKREQLSRANAFISSGPLFDHELLSETANGGR